LSFPFFPWYRAIRRKRSVFSTLPAEHNNAMCCVELYFFDQILVFKGASSLDGVCQSFTGKLGYQVVQGWAAHTSYTDKIDGALSETEEG
jgi:hypothetical protein